MTAAHNMHLVKKRLKYYIERQTPIQTSERKNHI